MWLATGANLFWAPMLCSCLTCSAALQDQPPSFLSSTKPTARPSAQPPRSPSYQPPGLLKYRCVPSLRFTCARDSVLLLCCNFLSLQNNRSHVDSSTISAEAAQVRPLGNRRVNKVAQVRPPLRQCDSNAFSRYSHAWKTTANMSATIALTSSRK